MSAHTESAIAGVAGATATKLTELANRCEKATGPDSMIDYAIARLRDENGKVLRQDPYTHSLDAAMTLVPEGYSVALHAHQEDQSRASVYWGAHGYNFSYAIGPALAVCASALRARAASLRDDASPAA